MRCLLGLLSLAACSGEPEVPVDAARPDAASYTAHNIELVGHAEIDMDDLNIGLAVAGTHAYVGHRYDGEIDIIDISDPAAPSRVGGFVAGYEATELRATTNPPRLYVLTSLTEVTVYDLANPVAPQRLGSVPVPNTIGHELFLWRDPNEPSRTLVVLSDVSTNGGFAVLDVSDATAPTIFHRQTGASLHAASVSDDGTRMYLSFIRGQVAIMDSTQLVAQGVAQTAPVLGSRHISACVSQSPMCIAHSAVKVPGRALVVATSENVSCPRGSMDLVDISDETAPVRVGGWIHPFADDCGSETGPFGYGAHNPTVTANLALVSWYRAGFLMFDISDPTAPTQVGSFYTNKPSAGASFWGRVASVSYPTIKDGLIYVLDGRNGLDILRYTGPRREEIDGVDFLEGNSNL